jgi:hypothetical protein
LVAEAVVLTEIRQLTATAVAEQAAYFLVKFS